MWCTHIFKSSDLRLNTWWGVRRQKKSPLRWHTLERDSCPKPARGAWESVAVVNHRRGCSVNLPLSSLSTPPIFIVLCRCQFYCFFPSPYLPPSINVRRLVRNILILFSWKEEGTGRGGRGGILFWQALLAPADRCRLARAGNHGDHGYGSPDWYSVSSNRDPGYHCAHLSGGLNNRRFLPIIKLHCWRSCHPGSGTLLDLVL